MNSNATPARGYYSILQFVPDLERSEGANIGVVLFCPERHFLKAQTATGNDRIRRFFGPEQDVELDLDRVNAFKATFEERVAAEAARIHTADQFQQFIDTRANQLLLSQPRPIKVFDPDAELARLFETLVGGRRRRAAQQEPSADGDLQKRLDEMLVERGLTARIERDMRIESVLLDRTLIFPFAFRNGHLNVIEPVVFGAANDRNIQRACELAVEGGDLIDRPDPVKLNVLGSFRPDQTESLEHVKAVLEKYHVRLHTAEQIECIVDEIERTAH